MNFIFALFTETVLKFFGVVKYGKIVQDFFKHHYEEYWCLAHASFVSNPCVGTVLKSFYLGATGFQNISWVD